MRNAASPTAIVDLLNAYFEQMVEARLSSPRCSRQIYRRRCLMAVWNAGLMPMTRSAFFSPPHKKCSQHWTPSISNADDNLERVQIGIGLATGTPGSWRHRCTTSYGAYVIGDAVNLASRLSDIAGAADVICDEATYLAARSPVGGKRLEPKAIKGKDKPVVLHRLPQRQANPWQG
ncbi:MAG: adenylate/guanylate cyclase domain-containing protein [Myxococcota bacterium]